jgi:hypothetical protein
MKLTGHSQAFRTKQRKPDYRTDTVVTLTPEFATRLAALTRTELQAELGEFLAEDQIEALDKRREALLADIGDDG